MGVQRTAEYTQRPPSSSSALDHLPDALREALDNPEQQSDGPPCCGDVYVWQKFMEYIGLGDDDPVISVKPAKGFEADKPYARPTIEVMEKGTTGETAESSDDEADEKRPAETEMQEGITHSRHGQKVTDKPETSGRRSTQPDLSPRGGRPGTDSNVSTPRLFCGAPADFSPSPRRPAVEGAEGEVKMDPTVLWPNRYDPTVEWWTPEGIQRLAGRGQLPASIEVSLQVELKRATGDSALRWCLEQGGNRICVRRLRIKGSGGAELGRILERALFGPHLQVLNVRGTRFRLEAWRAISLALADNESVKELNAEDADLSGDILMELVETLRDNRAMTSVSLRKNMIGDRGAGEIAAALRENRKLEELNLSATGVGQEGGMFLGYLLLESTPLRVLNLGRNSLGDAGIKALVDALQSNRALEELVLCSCEITDDSARALSGALRENRKLRRLDLSSNRFTCGGGQMLAHALWDNYTLETLDLSDNSIAEQGVGSLLEAASARNRSLSELYLAGNPYDVGRLEDMVLSVRSTLSLGL